MKGLDLTYGKIQNTSNMQSSFMSEIRTSKLVDNDNLIKNISILHTNGQMDQPNTSANDSGMASFAQLTDDTILLEEDISDAVFRNKSFSKNNSHQMDTSNSSYNNQSMLLLQESMLLNSKLNNTADEFQDGVKMIGYFKRLTDILQAQLEQKDNVIRSIIKNFRKIFIHYYQKRLNLYLSKQITFQQIKDFHAQMVEEINKFMVLILQTIFKYYNIVEYQNNIMGKLITPENMWNLIISYLFEEQMHCLVIEYFKIVFEKDQEQFQTQLAKLVNKEPQDF